MNKTDMRRIAWQRVKDSGILLPCSHCPEQYGLDNMEVHFIVKHDMTWIDAQEATDDIIGSLPLDEDGNPLADCTIHGLHRMDYGCDRCDRDSDIADDRRA